MGDGQWLRGTIVNLWTAQGPGHYAPYQVKLDDSEGKLGGKQTKEGIMIYAPADNDSIIRKATR